MARFNECGLFLCIDWSNKSTKQTKPSSIVKWTVQEKIRCGREGYRKEFRRDRGSRERVVSERVALGAKVRRERNADFRPERRMRALREGGGGGGGCVCRVCLIVGEYIFGKRGKFCLRGEIF